MVRRNLWNKKVNEEHFMRKIIFKRRCKIEGKCCKVIIDSGSLDNLATKELDSNFQLERLRHPNPYHIA